MPNRVRYLLLSIFVRVFAFYAAISFGRFLGSEGTARMMTFRNIALIFLILMLSSFLFQMFCYKKKESPRLLLCVSFLFFFVLSFYSYHLRFYLVSQFGLYLNILYSSYVISHVLPGEIIPSSSPAHSSPSTEDSFGIRVLMEPWPITPNLSLESSIKYRVTILENENSVFLLDKDKGAYWHEMQTALNQCSSQTKYNELLEFENRDLQIREHKHFSYSLFQQILTENPTLAESAPYTPQEVFLDFLNAQRDELDQQGGDVLLRDQRELEFLNLLRHDLRRHGPNSTYLKQILRE